MKSNNLTHLRQWLFGSSLLLLGNIALAAGLMTPTNSNLPALEIKEHHVTVVIEDGYAVTSVEQIFSNNNAVDLEAIYSFPIPEKAAVSEFTYWIDGQPITGEVLEKQQAKTIYQEEKQAGREAAITEQDGHKTFDISVYPVRANQEVKIRLSYIQPAHVDTAIGRYVYPLEEGGTDEDKLSFWTYNDAVTEKFSFTMRFRSSYPVDQLRLPQHPQAVIQQISAQEWSVTINENKTGASIPETNSAVNPEVPATKTAATSTAPAQHLNKDIVVYWRLQPGLPGSVDMITYKKPGSHQGTFMMTITPGDDLAAITEGRDWIFVLDYSGSMQGKYTSLTEGVNKGLRKLNANDRFKIILFNDGSREITQGYTQATPELINTAIQAMSSINPEGGTNLYAGVEHGMKSLDADRSSAIILVTDGEANIGLTEKKDFIKLLEAKDVRLFTFVMGNSANRPLLEGMAKVSNGFAMNISNSDDIVGKLMEATAKLNHQAFHDVDIKISGVKVSDLTPATIGSLYRGQQLIVLGHYYGEGDAQLSINGKISGHPKTYSTSFAFPQESQLYPELERLWAFATIEDMQNQLDYYGEDADIKQTITDLAIEKGLVTPYTSMVVMREEEFAKRGIDRKNAQRVADEQAAQVNRQNTAIQDHRVDHNQPLHNTPAPSHSSGSGGSMNLGMLLMLMLLFISGAMRKVKLNHEQTASKY